AIAVDASSPEDVIQTAFGRLTILCEDGFNSLHTLKKQRPAFQPAVRSVLGRLDSLLKNRQLVRKKRPNTLSYAEALDGVVNARSSDALVQTCLDLIVYDIEEAIRGLQALLKKGGEPGEGAANFLSWFPRFLEGQ
ncbi:MAG: hypothetical protein ACE5F1_19270, partial [Planctomycetota bacterium]